MSFATVHHSGAEDLEGYQYKHVRLTLKSPSSSRADLASL